MSESSTLAALLHEFLSPKGSFLKEINPLIFIGRTDAEAPILWSPDVKSWLIRKDLDAGEDWRQEEKGKTGNKMVGWCHWLNGHEFEQTPGDGEGQGGLACCSPWVHSQTWLGNWTTDAWLQASLMAHWKRIHLRCRRQRGCGFDPHVDKVPWRRKWQSTPIFLPEKSHRQRSLGPQCKGSQRVKHDWAHTLPLLHYVWLQILTRKPCWDFDCNCIKPVGQFGQNWYLYCVVF